MYPRYLWQLLRHKWFVFVESCKLGIPLLGIIHDWSKFLPSEFIPYARYFYGNYKDAREIWKFLPAYGGPTKEDVDAAFDVAWNLHQKRNKHHWQWWILMNDDSTKRWDIQEVSIGNPPILSCDGKPVLWCEHDGGDDAIHTNANKVLRGVCVLLNKCQPLAMPDKYIREMLADWRGAGRAYGNPDTMQWYIKNRHNQIMHEQTRAIIEQWLDVKGE